MPCWEGPIYAAASCLRSAPSIQYLGNAAHLRLLFWLRLASSDVPHFWRLALFTGVFLLFTSGQPMKLRSSNLICSQKHSSTTICSTMWRAVCVRLRAYVRGPYFEPWTLDPQNLGPVGLRALLQRFGGFSLEGFFLWRLFRGS